MSENFNLIIENYIEKSPKFEGIDWFDLPNSIKLKLIKLPKDVKQFGRFTTIRKLRQSEHTEYITRNIVGIKRTMTGSESFQINFPIKLKNKEYVRLYALMVSEGSYKTEFSLNVPEKEFHLLFQNCIEKLISKEAAILIRQDYNKGFLRSRAPAIIRHIIPLPQMIPYVILNNKDFAREYLRVAFEAEGSPILNKKQHKRYIKLSRYINITPLVLKEKIPLTKRIYSRDINRKYPTLYQKIKKMPPILLQSEQILLKHNFNIDSKLKLEAIRKNLTDKRCGKITARWVLLIYANNIDKFIDKIGFISKVKIKKTNEMKKIKGNNPQYSTLDLIKEISDDKGYFYRNRFVKNMENRGYKSPSAYLWRYCKKKLIKKVKRGYYKLLVN